MAENGDASVTSKSEECANINFGYKPKDAAVLFTGFLLPTKTQDYLVQLQDSIKTLGIDMDNTVSNKMHITLRFIGFVAPADFAKVKACLENAFADVTVPKISIKPAGFHLLKNPDGSPKLLLAKFDSAELKELYKTVNEKVEDIVGKSQFPDYLIHATVATFNSSQKAQSASLIEEKIDSLNKNQDVELPLGNLYLLGLPTEDLNDQYQNCKNYDRYYQFKE